MPPDHCGAGLHGIFRLHLVREFQRKSTERDRIGCMLLSLGREEVDSIITEQNRVEVTCDFCNAKRVFDAIDVAQLFATGSAAELTDTARPH